MKEKMHLAFKYVIVHGESHRFTGQMERSYHTYQILNQTVKNVAKNSLLLRNPNATASMPHISFFAFRQPKATTVRSSMPQQLSLSAIIEFLDDHGQP